MNVALISLSCLSSVGPTEPVPPLISREAAFPFSAKLASKGRQARAVSGGGRGGVPSLTPPSLSPLLPAPPHHRPLPPSPLRPACHPGLPGAALHLEHPLPAAPAPGSLSFLRPSCPASPRGQQSRGGEGRGGARLESQRKSAGPDSLPDPNSTPRLPDSSYHVVTPRGASNYTRSPPGSALCCPPHPSLPIPLQPLLSRWALEPPGCRPHPAGLPSCSPHWLRPDR